MVITQEDREGCAVGIFVPVSLSVVLESRWTMMGLKFSRSEIGHPPIPTHSPRFNGPGANQVYFLNGEREAPHELICTWSARPGKSEKIMEQSTAYPKNVPPSLQVFFSKIVPLRRIVCKK